MNKKGFTLIELIVSIVLVGIVLASMIGTLMSLKETYTVLNDDIEARTYSALVSKTINDHIMKNNGIKGYTCVANRCEMILGSFDSNGQNKVMTLEITTSTVKTSPMKDKNTTIGSLMEKATTVKYYGEGYSYYKTIKHYDRHYNDSNKDVETGYKFENIEEKSSLYEGNTPEDLKDYLVNITIKMNNPKYNIEIYSTSQVAKVESENLRLYTLTYNSNGGSTCPNNPKVGADRKPWGELCKPTRPNYGFEGWFIQQDGISVREITASTIALEDITVYAHWDSTKYSCPPGEYLPAGSKTCAECLEDNYCPGITDKYYDKFNNQGIIPCKSGYHSPKGSSVETSCKITCPEGTYLNVANDASCTNCPKGYQKGGHQVSEGQTSRCTLIDPSKPSISGGTTKIYGSADITLTCTTPTEYDNPASVYYSFGYSTTEGGTLGNYSTASNNNTFVISKTAYVGNRYYACRVYAGESGGNSTNTINSDGRTLVKIRNAKITFDKNDGALSGTSPLYTKTGVATFYDGELSSTTASAPTATKTGHDFNGWFTASTSGSKILSNTNAIQSTTVSGYIKSSKWTTTTDKTLYAQFSPHNYTLTFDCNGGSGAPSAATVAYGSKYTLTTSVCSTAKTGYTQDGWNTKSDGSGTNWNTSNTNNWTWNIANDVKLYAKWKANSYIITLDKNGATNTPTTSINATYMSSELSPNAITLPQKKYIVSGFELNSSRKSTGATVSSTSNITSSYTFYGWYTSASGGSKLLSNGSTLALQANVSNITDSSSNWIKIGGATVYARFSGGSITLPTITKDGYNCGWTTTSAETTISYASGASFTPTESTTMYGVCEPKTYIVNYYQGNGAETAGGTKFASSTTCTFGNDCTLIKYADLGGIFPYSVEDKNINGAVSYAWVFAGWGTTSSDKSVDYTNNQKINPTTYAETINLYAIGKKPFYFYGYNKDENKPVILNDGGNAIYQYWNPYNRSYLSTISVPAITSVSNWNICGYVGGSSDATSSKCTNATWASGGTQTPSFDRYGYNRSVYSRTVTLAYDKNGGAGTASNSTATQYLNSAYGSNTPTISAASFTLAASDTFTRNNATFAKWAEGSASGTQYSASSSYSWQPAATDIASKTMYAKWYVCASGTISGTNCVKTKQKSCSSDWSRSGVQGYYCGSSTQSSSTCTYAATASSYDCRTNSKTESESNKPGCGNSCPSGYTQTSNTCGTEYYCGSTKVNTTTCTKAASRSTRTPGCGNDCPDGYSVYSNTCSYSGRVQYYVCSDENWDGTSTSPFWQASGNYAITSPCTTTKSGSSCSRVGSSSQVCSGSWSGSKVCEKYSCGSSSIYTLVGTTCQYAATATSVGEKVCTKSWKTCDGIGGSLCNSNNSCCKTNQSSCGSWSVTATHYTCSGGQTPSGSTCSYTGTAYYTCSKAATIEN